MTALNFTGKVPRLFFAFAAGVVLSAEVANYYLQAPSAGWIVTWAGIAVLVTAAAFMISAVYSFHRREIAWWLLTATIVFFTAGALVNFSYSKITGSFPYPGPADALYLLLFPSAIAAFFFTGKKLLLKVSLWDCATSITIAGVMFGLLSYPFLIGPSSRLRVSLFTRAVTIAYPVGDAVLFACMLILILAMASSEALYPAYWMILAGTGWLLIADSIFAYVSLNWAWNQPSSVDMGWFAWFICWAFAAFLPSNRPPEIISRVLGVKAKSPASPVQKKTGDAGLSARSRKGLLHQPSGRLPPS